MIHVMPVDDEIEHEATEDCVCFPEARLVQLPSGGDGWILTHHALKRESYQEEPKMR